MAERPENSVLFSLKELRKIEDDRIAREDEIAEQERLTATEDWKEGVAAMADRRTPDFSGR